MNVKNSSTTRATGEAIKEFRQPRALWALIALKTCDSFGYLGLRALLIIYLTAELHMVDRTAFDIVGGFLALSYLTPVVGGVIADRAMSCRSVASAGAALTMLGYLSLAACAARVTALSRLKELLFGLACVAAGNGFIKASVMTLVGRLYVPQDPRREAGFSLGYTGMNIGQLLSAILSSWAAYTMGWAFAFALLALSSGLCLLILNAGLDEARLDSTVANGRAMQRWAGAIAVPITVAACTVLLFQRAALGWILAAALPATAVYIIRLSISHGSHRDQVNTQWAIVLATFAAIGWTFVEQAAGSLNLLALRHLPRVFLHLTISAPQYQSLNPIFLIVLCPLAASLWSRLSRTRRDLGTAYKFALGFLFFAASFLALSVPALLVETNSLSPWWLVIAYLLSAVGELLVSPIGLAAMTRLSLPSLAATMMGFWYLSLAAGDFMAQKLGTLTSVGQTTSDRALATYGRVFLGFSCASLLAAGALLLIRRGRDAMHAGSDLPMLTVDSETRR